MSGLAPKEEPAVTTTSSFIAQPVNTAPVAESSSSSNVQHMIEMMKKKPAPAPVATPVATSASSGSNVQHMIEMMKAKKAHK